MREYSRLRKDFLSDNPVCQMDGCNAQACDVHHKSGRRGGNYLAVDTWMSLCRACHDWIHAHSNEAREKGYLTDEY